MKKFPIIIGLFVAHMTLNADRLDLLLLSGHSIQKENLMHILSTHPKLLKTCRNFIKNLPDKATIQTNFLKLYHQLEKNAEMPAQDFCIIHHIKFSARWSEDILQLLLNPQSDESQFFSFEENLQLYSIKDWLQNLHMFTYAPCGNLCPFLRVNEYLCISEEQRCVWELLDCLYLAKKQNLNTNSALHLFEVRFQISQRNDIFQYAILLKALHKNCADMATI